MSLVGLLMAPFFQKQLRFLPDSWTLHSLNYGSPSAIYMNVLKLPLFADFDCPEKYGLSRENV